MPNSPRMGFPYPSENQDPWYEAFRVMIEAQDASGYASREDRQLILSEGGVISWNVPLLVWSGTIRILSPITGFQIQVSAGSATLDDGQVLYVNLTRAPTQSVVVTAEVASQVPSSDQALVLVIRVGTRLYWRNGLLLEDGNSVSGLGAKPGISGDLREASIIVGNVGVGDTVNTCDYLDIGDGAQLAAAIAAAAVAEKDVFVRRGTYDLGLVGSPATRIVIPPGVRVCGAGPQQTIVRTKAVGDGGAFVLSARAILEDVYVFAPTPTGPQIGTEGIINLSGDRSEVRRVWVECDGGWATISDPTWVLLDGAFFVPATFVTGSAKLVDCCGIDIVRLTELGGGVFYGIGVFGGNWTEVSGSTIIGGDWGGFFGKRVIGSHCVFDGAFLGGVEFVLDAIGSVFVGNNVLLDVTAVQPGILITNVAFVKVSDNWIETKSGFAGTAIDVVSGTHCTITGNHGTGAVAPPLGWATAVNLDGLSGSNIVLGNNFSGAPYSDFGVANEVSHNR